MNDCPKPEELPCPLPPDLGPLMLLTTNPPKTPAPKSHPYAGTIAAGANQSDMVAAQAHAIEGLLTDIAPGVLVASGKGARLKLPVIDWDPAVRMAVLALEVGSRLHFSGPELNGQLCAELSLHQPEAKPRPFVTIKAYDDKQIRDMAKLTQQWARPAGWNRQDEFVAQQNESLILQFSQVVGLQRGRHPFTYELLEAAENLLVPVLMGFKQALAMRRPHEVLTPLPTALEVPANGALPGGHAAVAYLLADLLTEILGEARANKTLMHRIAARIAHNRVLAGLHHPADSIAGAMLGMAWAQLLLGQGKTWSFALPQSLDWGGVTLASSESGQELGCITCHTDEQSAVDLPNWKELLAAAKKEWN